MAIDRDVDALGLVTKQGDGESNWFYSYDAIGRLATVNFPQSDKSDLSVAWPAVNQRTITRNPYFETQDLDGYGRTTKITREGIVTNITYDVLGRRKFESMPGSPYGTTFTHDVLNRVTQAVTPLGARGYDYQSSGDLVVTNERGKSTRYKYDRYGNPDEGFVVEIHPPEAGTQILISRNLAGTVVGAVQQAGVQRVYALFPNTQFLGSIYDPETGVTEFGRDAVGNMYSKKVNGGPAIIFGHDGLNRLETINYPDTTPDVTLSYNRRSQVTGVQSSVVNRWYGYDFDGNMTSDELVFTDISPQLSLLVKYNYNAIDGLYSIEYPKTKGTVTYDADDLGRPRQASPYLTSVSHHPSGNVQSITYGNALVQGFGEDLATQLPISIGVPNTFQLNYSYLPNSSNINEVTGSNGPISVARTLGYDGNDRLTTANGPWGTSSGIEYYTSGNIKKQTFGTAVTTYTYTTATNLLESTSGEHALVFSYDSRGNVLGNSEYVFGYDLANNMVCDAPAQLPAVACASATGPKSQYAYDGKGWRVWQLKNGIKSYFHHAANGDLMFEYTPNGDQWKKHVYLAGKRVATEASDPIATTTTLNFVTDGSGNITALQATVTPSAATGTVSFIQTGGATQTATLTTGVATIPVTGLACGLLPTRAAYIGEGAHGSSSSATQNIAVVKCVPTVNWGPFFYYSGPEGEPVYLQARLSGSAGFPTGTVVFRDGSVDLGIATLAANGYATLVPTTLARGTHSLTAHYTGDASYQPGSTLVVTYHVTSADANADDDLDGAPNGIERQQLSNPLLKDNYIFVSPWLFAKQQYRDFFGREGDAAGVADWGGRIDAGTTSRPQMIEAFMNAPEYQNMVPPMIRLYSAFFLRIPDFPGLMYQVGELRAGAPIGAIADNFSLSPEFTSRYGSLTDEQYVDLVYQNVLGRAPDPGGRQYYLERLADGRLTRGTMMVGFSESPEYRGLTDKRVMVIGVFAGMLRRVPTEPDVDYYVGQIDAGLTQLQFITNLTNAPEYRNRFLAP